MSVFDKPYHVIKASRVYSGRGYCGASSNNTPQEYETLRQAIYAATKLVDSNPVGWDVVHATSGKILYKAR